MIETSTLRIGIDASTLGHGGASTHLRELLSAAQPREQGVDRVVVWCSRALANNLPTREWLVVNTPLLLSGPRVLRPFWSWMFAKEIRQNCDVLLVPAGLSFGRFSPFVAMSRNLLPFDPNERARYGWTRTGIRLRLLALFQTATFRKAAGVVFLTATASETVRRRTGKLRRVTVIPHGVADTFRAVPREQKPLAAYAMDRPFRLIYVSVLDRYKHQLELARAVTSLRSRGLPVALDLVGPPGPIKPDLDRFIEAVDPRHSFVRYHGPVPYSELPNWYQKADAAVFASTCENMPNTLVEMMASGLPIACSNRGVMPEIFRDSGPMFDPENSESVSAALEQLITDAALRTESANKSYTLSQNYSWRRCADQTLAFLVRVAGRPEPVSIPEPHGEGLYLMADAG